MLLVNTTGLTVTISSVFVTVEHLQFVSPHKKDTAITSSLPRAFYRIGSTPFDMQLAIAESLFGANTASVLCYSHSSISELPLHGWFVSITFPLRKILTIE